MLTIFRSAEGTSDPLRLLLGLQLTLFTYIFLATYSVEMLCYWEYGSGQNQTGKNTIDFPSRNGQYNIIYVTLSIF